MNNSSDNKQDKKSQGRRNLVKQMTFSGGVLASVNALPGNWAAPELSSVILPAHAGISVVCTVPFQVTGTATLPSSDPFTGTYTGSLNNSGPFSGDCSTDILFPIAFNAQPLEVVIASLGGDLYRITYRLPNAPFEVSYDSTITETNVGAAMGVMMGSGVFNGSITEEFQVEGSDGFSDALSKEEHQATTTFDDSISGWSLNYTINGELCVGPAAVTKWG